MTDKSERAKELNAERNNLPGYVDLRWLFTQPPHEEKWLIPNVLAVSRATSLYGPAKIGKSMLALSMVGAIVTGKPFAGMPTQRARVLYVDYENLMNADVRPRLEAMGYTWDELQENLIILSMPNIPDLDKREGGRTLCKIVKDQCIDLVVIDTVSRTISGEENSNDTWSRFYNSTGKPLKEMGVAMLRLDHTGKDESKGVRGGSGKRADVDINCKISKVKGVFTLQFVDGRIPALSEKLVMTLETKPNLHFQLVDPAPMNNPEVRIMSIMRQLDESGLPREATNNEVRTRMQSLGISASNEISGKITKRRQTSLVEVNEEIPANHRDDSALTRPPAPIGHIRDIDNNPRKSQSHKGLNIPPESRDTNRWLSFGTSPTPSSPKGCGGGPQRKVKERCQVNLGDDKLN